MNYCNIISDDVTNGEGVRVTLFVSGCRNNCPGCFNPQAQCFSYGKQYTNKTKNEIIKLLNNQYIKGLSLLGGDPFEPENQECVLDLVKTVKNLYPEKDIWVWSGFYFEELFSPQCRANSSFIYEILNNIDVLIDGRFVQALKQPGLKYKGSTNQRVIDVKETMKGAEIKLYC